MIVTADQDWLSRTPGRSPPYVITATTRCLPGDDDHNLAGLVFRRIGQCISPDSRPNARRCEKNASLWHMAMPTCVG